MIKGSEEPFLVADFDDDICRLRLKSNQIKSNQIKPNRLWLRLILE